VQRCALVLALLTSLAGCDKKPSPPSSEGASPASTSGAPCTPRVGERLGIPFVKVCPEDLKGIDAKFEPFFIAAQQLGCSAGEHDTLRCPTVTALQHPAPGETRAPPAPRRSLAAVVEARIAQNVCYMRFGGRLPTRVERARAEEALGIASVMVVTSEGDPKHFDFLRLREWVSEEPLTTPNVSGSGVGEFPSGERGLIPWARLARCEGAPLAGDAGVPLLGVGESCPAPGFAFGEAAALLPCGVKSPAARPSVVGFSLACLPPAPDARHPDDDAEKTAAFRCVLPPSANIPLSDPER